MKMENSAVACGRADKAPRNIGIIVSDGFILADIVDLAEIFVPSDKLISSISRGGARYVLSVMSLSGGMMTASTGVRIMTEALSLHDGKHFDTLIVAGGGGNFESYKNQNLVEWLQNARGRARRIAGLCAGVFVLAAAGFLDERRAAIHWALQDKLKREFPRITIDRDAQLVDDNGIFTAGDFGMASDLAWRLHNDDLGSAAAKRMARGPLSSTQRSSLKASDWTGTDATPRKSRIHEASDWLTENMASQINTSDAADFSSMSERNFQRRFKRETGETPRRFLQKIRMDAACRQLSETDLPIEKIAARCGFLNEQHMNKLFQKYLNMSPDEYRRRPVFMDNGKPVADPGSALAGSGCRVSPTHAR